MLEPRIDKNMHTNLLLYVHPLYIRIGTQALSVSTENERKAESLLGDIASQYSELLPHLTIPLAKDFSVAFPSNQLPLTVPTQAGKLNGQIDIPGLSLQSTVSVSGVLFLSDGVHVFLAANTQPAKSTQGTVFPDRIEDHPAVYTSGSNLDSAIKAERWANSILAGEYAIVDIAVESGGFGCAHLGVAKASSPRFRMSLTVFLRRGARFISIHY